MPEVISKIIEAGKNLFSYLTWTRIAMLTVLLALGAVSMAFWENRPAVYASLRAGKFESGSLQNISDKSKNTIKRLVDKDPNLVAVQIISTDFHKFVRTTAFFYAKSSQFQADFDAFYENKTVPSPILSVGDEQQNARLIAIINQEFVCVDLPPNVIRNLPTAPRYAKHLCSISVPPQFGKMVGYINLWLKEKVADEDKVYYQTLARTVGDEIYNRDVLKTEVK